MKDSLASHPLVSLLFYFLGADVNKNKTETLKMVDETESMNDPMKQRTLSWKDEKVNGGSLSTTSTFKFDHLGEFADVAGPDQVLRSDDEQRGPLKPKVLHRGSQEDNGSPNNLKDWGFFVSITPPTSELYSSVSKKGNGTSSPPSSSAASSNAP